MKNETSLPAIPQDRTPSQFADLKFQPHRNIPGAIHALAFFTNGYGISVVGGGMLIDDGIDYFEVAVLRGTDENNFEIWYENEVSQGDTFHGVTKESIASIIYLVKSLAPAAINDYPETQHPSIEDLIP